MPRLFIYHTTPFNLAFPTDHQEDDYILIIPAVQPKLPARCYRIAEKKSEQGWTKALYLESKEELNTLPDNFLTHKNNPNTKNTPVLEGDAEKIQGFLAKHAKKASTTPKIPKKLRFQAPAPAQKTKVSSPENESKDGYNDCIPSCIMC